MTTVNENRYGHSLNERIKKNPFKHGVARTCCNFAFIDEKVDILYKIVNFSQVLNSRVSFTKLTWNIVALDCWKDIIIDKKFLQE